MSTPAKPFTNIAISLSGGGFRATAFHLGALSMLDNLSFSYSAEKVLPTSLLQRVSIISTVSGGTIVGARYALDAANGQPFITTFKKLYFLMEEDRLLEDAFDKLKPSSKWASGFRNVNMINAFAEVYHEKFFDKATFKNLYNNPNTHLCEVIFNATEFTNSLPFRFQTGGKFGNGKIEIPDTIAKEIRIADTVAASSCFPSGFEPIEIPRDLSTNANSELMKYWKEKKYEPTALMDGGIIDNQGIDGVLKAEDRNEEKDADGKIISYVGTFLISDVTRKLGNFSVPTKVIHNKGVSLTILNWVLAIIGLICANILFFSTKFHFFLVGFSLILFSLIVIYFIVFLLLWDSLKKVVRGVIGNQNLLNLSSLRIIRLVPIQILKFLITYRVVSTVHMVNNVFMKRIRDLQINGLFKDKYWRNRIKVNYIYELLNEQSDIVKLTGDLGEKIPPIIEYANSMNTTLWFTKEETDNKMLDHLLMAGQITMCTNLIVYIDKLKKWKDYTLFSESDRTDIQHFQNHLLAVLEDFKAKPEWLLEKLK